MKRRFLWLAALAGVVWLYLRRGGRRPEPVVGVPSGGDPAEQLRRKLDETKGRDEEPVSHLATPEPEAEPVEPAEADDPPESAERRPVVSEELEARRREVHERARAASDEMRRSSSD